MSIHTFEPAVAAEYGVVEAVVIKSFQFWISHNHANGTHRYDDRTWTYNSTRGMRKLFPYLSEKQIYGVLKRLIEGGVLVTGNYNRTGFDRTTWYAFADEDRWIPSDGQLHLPKRENGSPAAVRPIPVSNTDTKPVREPDPPAQAREGVFIVHGDGRVIPKIPVIPPTPVPEKPEIPAQRAPGAAKKPHKKPDRDWQRWVDRYERHVTERNHGIGHHWTKAQLGPQGLKGIRAHLVRISTKAAGQSDDDCGFGAWCYILDHWDNIGDDWLRGQFDLCVLLKKITDILNRLKNGTQTTGAAPAGGGAKLSASAAREQALRDY